MCISLERRRELQCSRLMATPPRLAAVPAPLPSGVAETHAGHPERVQRATLRPMLGPALGRACWRLCALVGADGSVRPANSDGCRPAVPGA